MWLFEWGGEACRDNLIEGILRFYLKIYHICFFSFASYFRISQSLCISEMYTELYVQSQQTHCVLGSDVAFFWNSRTNTSEGTSGSVFRVHNSYIDLFTTINQLFTSAQQFYYC